MRGVYTAGATGSRDSWCSGAGSTGCSSCCGAVTTLAEQAGSWAGGSTLRTVRTLPNQHAEHLGEPVEPAAPSGVPILRLPSIRRPLKRTVIVIGAAPVACLAFLLFRTRIRSRGATRRSRLTDAEFWQLASTSSEADGTFHSENLVSNEADFQRLIPSLRGRRCPDACTSGVGSEQNFSYIAAVRPSFAFIVDIRRGNFDLQLLYKALFELSADRADFVVAPVLATAAGRAHEGLDRGGDLRGLRARSPPNRDALHPQPRAARGTSRRRRTASRCPPSDRRGLAYVYDAWFTNGPDIHYELNNGGGFGGRGGPGGFPTYADLMTSADDRGQNRSFLGSESNFAVVKALETRNLLVPVVGNFGGAKALAAVATYLRRTGQTVSTFYVSNVEQYLRQDGLWEQFCRNASAFPIDGSSVFIRSMRGGFGGMARRHGLRFVPRRPSRTTSRPAPRAERIAASEPPLTIAAPPSSRRPDDSPTDAAAGTRYCCGVVPDRSRCRCPTVSPPPRVPG